MWKPGLGRLLTGNRIAGFVRPPGQAGKADQPAAAKASTRPSETWGRLKGVDLEP
jgi:hypothetical protein